MTSAWSGNTCVSSQGHMYTFLVTLLHPLVWAKNPVTHDMPYEMVRLQKSWRDNSGSMTIPNLSWYLCILFVVALAAESAMTVEPGVLAFKITGMWLALSILFAAVAIIFKWFRVPQPKWLLRLFQGLAVLATVVVLAMVGG